MKSISELRVLGYVGASTDKKVISPEVQTEQLRSAAELLGWGSLDLRQEDAASAKSMDGRPVLRCRTGRPASSSRRCPRGCQARPTVAVHRRLRRAAGPGRARALGDHLPGPGGRHIQQCGRFASEVMPAAAALERRLIAQRTREGMARIRDTTGKHMGRPSRIPREVEARIVTLHSAGSSASAIARLFNEERVPKGEGLSPLWNHSHVMAAVRRAVVQRRAASAV